MYVDSIKPGFNSMETIVAFSKTLKKPTDCKAQVLVSFNKSHRTNHTSWDDVSKDIYNLTSWDIVEYHALLNWYLMYKTSKDHVEYLVSLLDEKDKKKLHDHTLQSFLF